MALLAINENEINIGAVVQFLPAQFPQPDHCKMGHLPVARGVLVKRLAKTCHGALPAKLKHRAQTHVGHVGNLPRDFRGISKASKVPRGDAQHLPLLKLTELCERIDMSLCGLFEPGAYFRPQPLFPSRMPQIFHCEHRREPFRMNKEQLAHCWRTAEHSREDARLLDRELF